ncbi:GbsR/MarR family transcriptional regulator [Hoyosella subflava]|uniref:Putative transcriptional regulator n=1 Tax=Hoyosella subflava (strain DSM 45089 / JCM 17490 / NBRC 109087 / DQS3-9A1) TaxID=443218 RepID=F6ERA7_HOYSD|nr:MarR family transcriptional regulator [Hoyosella subflava]AEF41985.1 Putative transcriptional regulator [Hoyosella subflava DQS3-9A1]
MSDLQDDEYREKLLQFVEKLAMLLTEAGLPRMAARVFAYVLAEDSDKYTAKELADGLRVSPAAISGAVRPLVQGGMLTRGRDPGERADHYRVDDSDVWGTIISQRRPMLRRYIDLLSEGARDLGGDRRGSRRLRETVEFYRFMDEDLTETMKRWKERRAEWVEEEERRIKES